jgi:glycerophosphoryl diester phosphodiesterase
LVASHRGASIDHPENTLAAFRRATELGVALQEFDVRELVDGELVCVHDDTWARTTDSGQRPGMAALVAETDLAAARALNAAAQAQPPRREQVPTLREALAVMLPTCVPLIERKAGAARRYLEVLRREQQADKVILQSFDWSFLAEVRRLAPEIALGALGPTPTVATLTPAAIQQIQSIGAQLVDWRAGELTREQVELAHSAGMLVCTFTTDDQAGWLAGRALGVDAMCTNDPAGMRRALEGPTP